MPAQSSLSPPDALRAYQQDVSWQVSEQAAALALLPNGERAQQIAGAIAHVMGNLSMLLLMQAERQRAQAEYPNQYVEVPVLPADTNFFENKWLGPEVCPDFDPQQPSIELRVGDGAVNAAGNPVRLTPSQMACLRALDAYRPYWVSISHIVPYCFNADGDAQPQKRRTAYMAMAGLVRQLVSFDGALISTRRQREGVYYRLDPNVRIIVDRPSNLGDRH